MYMPDYESNEQRAMLCRGSGRWVIEVWNDPDEVWDITIWRGVSLARAMHEAKRMEDEGVGVFRIRDVDTNAELLAAIL